MAAMSRGNIPKWPARMAINAAPSNKSETAYVVMTSIVMARVLLAYVLMAYVLVAYKSVMAYIVIAYIVLANIKAWPD